MQNEMNLKVLYINVLTAEKGIVSWQMIKL